MGKITGFMEYKVEKLHNKPVSERIKDYKEFVIPLSDEAVKLQGARCMECGVPFCHSGCPLGNLIPEWNDLVYKGKWEEALRRLELTNNFPEVTGRICPAPCEGSCVLGINEPPVSIKVLEYSIAEKGFSEEWIKPLPPLKRTGKKVAVVGSGPAGLATAMQLNRAGHTVTVYERADRPGGLLMYGIPTFKLDKNIILRRAKQMEAEGVVFKTSTNVGVDFPVDQLIKENDAVVLACGSTVPRDLPIPGRELKGVYQAMEFLPQQNKKDQGDKIDPAVEILATGKKVVVIGGGDTGSDCVGTSIRQGAVSVTQIEIMPKPPGKRADNNPWPQWPNVFRTSTSHEEGCTRDFNVLTKSIEGANGQVKKLNCVRVEWVKDDQGRMQMKEIAGSEFTLEADLIFLAMGFLHPEHNTVVKQLGVEINERGNVKVDASWQTSVKNVFATGDMEKGQSLVVWAISNGRKTAAAIDKTLMGEQAVL